MPKVTFSNVDQTSSNQTSANQTVEADEGQTLLEVALKHDVPLQHACGGFCSCTTCCCIVTSGSDKLSKMEDDEDERLEETDQRKGDARLGCQARVMGDVTVEIVNVDA